MRYILLIASMLMFSLLMGNSIFSFDGMPQEYSGNDIYGLGMGETGSGDLFRINPNFTNPSVAITTDKVLFSTGVSLGWMWYKDIDDNEYRDDGIYFPYFSIAVPLKNHRIGFNFNSMYSGNLENKKEINWISTFGDTLDYTETNKLSSNIYRADALYAYKNLYVNFGIAVNYYIGHRIRYWKLDFDEYTMVDTKYEIEKTFKNPGVTVGLSKKLKNLSFSTTYSSYTKLEGNVIYK